MKTKLFIISLFFLAAFAVKCCAQDSIKIYGFKTPGQTINQIDTISFLKDYNQLQQSKNIRIGTILLTGIAASLITQNILLFPVAFIIDCGIIVIYQIKERKLEKKYFY